MIMIAILIAFAGSYSAGTQIAKLRMGEILSELDSVVVDLSVGQSQLDEEDAERFRKIAEVMFPKVEKAVQGLRTAADRLDKVWTTKCSVGILGGFITVFGGIATVMTAGAATPLLASSGMVIGVMGAGTTVTGRIIELFINSKEIKKAESDLEEALDSIRHVQAIMEGWLEKKAAFLAWDIAELGFTIRDMVENKRSDAAKDFRQKADKLENIMKRLEEKRSVLTDSKDQKKRHVEQSKLT